MLQELIMANKGINLLNPLNKSPLLTMSQKGAEKYDGTHVNIASYMTDSYMAETTISRHVGELEPLITEKYMAWQGNQL